MATGSGHKRFKKEIRVRDEFKARFLDKDIGNRKIVFGKPIAGKSFISYGAVKLFSGLGFESFIVDLPKNCYPDLVKEYYANLHVDQHSQFVSFVADKMITLTPLVLNVILRLTHSSTLSIHTKRGSKSIDGFSAINQLKLLRNMYDLEEFVAPSITQVIPMAHLLFKICLVNICPRLESHSNFSCQDVTMCAMLLSGRGFDLSDLILNNMMDVFYAAPSTDLPYGLLLTRVFEWYGVDLLEESALVAKEFLDNKCLSQSSLRVEPDGTLIQLELHKPSPPRTAGFTVSDLFMSHPEYRMSKFMHEFRDGMKKIVQRLDGLAEEVKFLREMALGPRTSASARTTPKYTRATNDDALP